MQKHVIEATEKAVEYIHRVTLRQERLLSLDDLFDGYKSVIRKNQFTLPYFALVYETYKEKYNSL